MSTQNKHSGKQNDVTTGDDDLGQNNEESLGVESTDRTLAKVDNGDDVVDNVSKDVSGPSDMEDGKPYAIDTATTISSNPATNEVATAESTSNSTTESPGRTKSKRIRRAPVKFVARPSKQGVGVQEGDEEWAKYGSFHHLNVINSVKKKSQSDGDANIDGSGAVVQLKRAAMESELTKSNNDVKSTEAEQLTKLFDTKKRKNDTAGGGTSKKLKSNSGEGIRVKATVDEEDDGKPAAVPKRKSAISRR